MVNWPTYKDRLREWIAGDNDLPRNAHRVAVLIIQHLNQETRSTFLTEDTLAEKLGIAPDDDLPKEGRRHSRAWAKVRLTVRRGIEPLEEKHYLRRRTAGRKTYYQFSDPPPMQWEIRKAAEGRGKAPTLDGKAPTLDGAAHTLDRQAPTLPVPATHPATEPDRVTRYSHHARQGTALARSGNGQWASQANRDSWAVQKIAEHIGGAEGWTVMDAAETIDHPDHRRACERAEQARRDYNATHDRKIGWIRPGRRSNTG